MRHNPFLSIEQCRGLLTCAAVERMQWQKQYVLWPLIFLSLAMSHGQKISIQKVIKMILD